MKALRQVHHKKQMLHVTIAIRTSHRTEPLRRHTKIMTGLSVWNDGFAHKKN